MIKLTALFVLLCCSVHVHAQGGLFVIDNENLFSRDEAKRIDSLLQDYYRKTGNLVAVYSDTADISVPGFADKVYPLLKTSLPGGAYSLLLLMSRQHSLIYLTANEPLTPFVNQQLLAGILEAGIPALKEKRREEGVSLICKKAMEFIQDIRKQ